MMELKKVINGVGAGQGSRDDDYELQEERIIYPDHADWQWCKHIKHSQSVPNPIRNTNAHCNQAIRNHYGINCVFFCSANF